jgi:hypothetical protein
MRYITVLFCVFSFLSLPAQVKNFYKAETIGTVQFFRQGYPLSFPAIELNGADNLELRFDVFTSSRADFYYSLELYDYNWMPVAINAMDYLEGFDENTFEAFSNSVNTTVDYIHYRLTLPNEDIKITQSGNYIVGVFRDREKLDTILLQRFIVYEDFVSLELSVDKFQSELLEDRQELNATINPGQFSLNDLTGNIKLSVIQNNDWNTCHTFEKYTSDYNNKIVFNTPSQIVFNGRNEFRFFDMKSLKHFSERVKSVNYEAPFYHIYLKPDKIRGDKDYFSREDLNGIFYIDNTDTDDEEIIDADYVYVHFFLETGYPFPADVYIDGALTGWELSGNFMEFNTESGNYEKIIPLKQGLYNYRYVLKEYDSKEYSTEITEGDYYQTVNNYLAIVYYRALGEVYYKPIGITSFTTN